MTDRQLLEQLLYQQRLTNWLLTGRGSGGVSEACGPYESPEHFADNSERGMTVDDLQCVGDPVVLTETEREAAESALLRNFSLTPEMHLGKIIQAINHVRDPDPVGTVRHSGNDELAIKRERHWLVVHKDYLEEVGYPPHEDWWPVIYTPEPKVTSL